MGQIRIGMSGWTYPPWRGRFYPKKWVQHREVEYASRQVSSLEINGTFYSLQKPATFKSWSDEVPDDFIFSVKAPQYMTHVRRLKDMREPLATFLASGLLCLGKKLGPILWQLPPNLTFKDDRLEKFLQLLPHDSRAASALAKEHGPKVKGRAFTQALGLHPVRHAVEFRHPSFAHKDVFALLREHNVAAVMSHAGKHSVEIEKPTADFVYLRFLGEEKGYARGYPAKVIKEWATRLKNFARQGDVFAYFGTAAKEYAPSDALRMMSALKSVDGAKKEAA